MRFCGGFKVYPSEVESCLAQHRAGALSAVIGVPHATWGEAVMAVALLKEGAGVEAAELIAHVTERKGVVRAPKVVEFVSALPLTPPGRTKPYQHHQIWSARPRRCCGRQAGGRRADITSRWVPPVHPAIPSYASSRWQLLTIGAVDAGNALT
jgi:hypothetical protein